MSKVINVSQKLGQYMLSGWVLTDVPCTTCRVPLMRSPQGKLPITHFCANCDNEPDSSSSSNDYSDVSTPPTEVSNPPDSPQFMPVQDTEDIRRRREQSDRASQEIGNRLLQGWAMLADECPGPTCYGVPLVRPPKAGGQKDSRKECVICGTLYISEVDSMGRPRLTPLNVINQNSNASRAETPSSNMQVIPTVPDAVTQTSHDVTSRFTASSLPRQIHRGTETLHALEESSKSLQSALRTLSARLESLCRQDIPVDPLAIGSTADAILKVTQALSHVKLLEQSERQGRSLCFLCRKIGFQSLEHDTSRVWKSPDGKSDVPSDNSDSPGRHRYLIQRNLQKRIPFWGALSATMPRFNIFKALIRRTGNSPNQSKVTDRSLPEQSSNLGNSQSLPSKKPRAVLTKRKPLGRQQSQPSYNLHSEDIGYHELGRYPTNLPEPTVAESKPPQYTDPHSHVEETRIDYPTMTQDSFHPIGQSSKRWSPVPDVYREPVTGEYDDDDTAEPHMAEPHMAEPQQHVRSRELQRSRSRKRIEAAGDDDIPLSRSTTGIIYPHGHRGSIPIDVDPEDTHDVHYLPDSTMRSDVPSRSLSMKKSPVSFTGGDHVSHNDAYPRDLDSNYIEPVIFEHEVMRNDGEPNPKIWHYIVPGGLDVIFRDEDGNELTRIRNMGDKSTKRRIIPMVIEDEHGKVIYRTGDIDSLSDSSGSDLGGPQKKYPYESRPQKPMQPEVPGSEPVIRTPVWIRRRSGSPVRHVYTSYLSPEAEKVILINEHGKQIPLVDRRKRRPARQGRQSKDEKLR